MSATHFVTSPIGYAVKDKTLYLITGKKEHDLDTAKRIAPAAIGCKPEDVQALPPTEMPADFKVLVMRADDVATGSTQAGSDHYEAVADARRKAAAAFSTTGFNAVHPRTRPDTTNARLPKDKDTGGIADVSKI